MDRIRKINLKVAGYLNITALIVTIIVHALVIINLMPFTWINGGRSTNFAIGQQTSIFSIGILLVMIFVNMWACGVIKVRKYLTVLKVLLWTLFVYSIFGLVQQLLGTTFEKLYMSILCLINIVMYFRLAIEKRSLTK